MVFGFNLRGSKGNRNGSDVSGSQDLASYQQEQLNDQPASEQDEQQSYQQSQHNDSGMREDEEDETITSAEISPASSEKDGLLRKLGEIRGDNAFCDASLLCKGILFRAHKVVISSWSRWLRSLLIESPDDEVLSLDIFNPDALGAVLDYMYGIPINVNVDTADDFICVARRLEMNDLEQYIWKFLITVINTKNCDKMHALADKYDCPPLKLAAFRYIKERDPTYAMPPERIHEMYWHHADIISTSNQSKIPNDCGLTGPGESNFSVGVDIHQDKTLSRFDNDEEEFRDDYGNDLSRYPSILNPDDGIMSSENGGDEHNENDDGNTENGSVTNTRKPRRLEDLPATASARDVVLAWSMRLQEVYQLCAPKESQSTVIDKSWKESSNNMKYYVPKRAVHSPGSLTASRLPKDMVSSWSNIPKQSEIDWHKELKQFYLEINLPEKVNVIDDILSTWTGREDQMISSLMAKYEKSLSPSMLQHLETLLSIAETKTDSSFVPPVSSGGNGRYR